MCSFNDIVLKFLSSKIFVLSEQLVEVFLRSFICEIVLSLHAEEAPISIKANPYKI